MIKKIFQFVFAFTCFCQLLAADQNHGLDRELARKYLYMQLSEQFPNETIEVDVIDNQVIVYTFPQSTVKQEQIIQYLESVLGNQTIRLDHSYRPVKFSYLEQAPSLVVESENTFSTAAVGAPIEEGEWLPELNPFFPTLLAQPHIVGYSAGYRSYDKTFKIACLPVSIGDQFSLYQFKSIPVGQLYFGIEACVWAIFEAKTKSLALINADYYIALPLTYIHDRFAVRLRVFHESSHLGDEILIENKNIHRLNPSMEVVDLFVSYQATRNLTLFAGISRVLRSDDSYKVKPNGIYYGFNYYLDMFKIKICNLDAVPYIATYFNNMQENKWNFNSSIAVGYEWNKSYGHKFRLFLEGHDGYSQEGQFSKQKTQYIALKLLYGY